MVEHFAEKGPPRDGPKPTDPLHDEVFAALHQAAGTKSDGDAGKCRDARQTDHETSLLLSDPFKNKDALLQTIATDRQGAVDAGGELQDSGSKGKPNAKIRTPGDDDKNMALDQQVIDADRNKLQQGGLDAERVAALNNDIQLRTKDMGFNSHDIVDEQRYIANDDRLTAALKSGNQADIEAAAAAVKADKEYDHKKEKEYSDNDDAMTRSSANLQRLFGNDKPK